MGADHTKHVEDNIPGAVVDTLLGLEYGVGLEMDELVKVTGFSRYQVDKAIRQITMRGGEDVIIHTNRSVDGAVIKNQYLLGRNATPLQMAKFRDGRAKYVNSRIEREHAEISNPVMGISKEMPVYAIRYALVAKSQADVDKRRTAVLEAYRGGNQAEIQRAERALARAEKNLAVAEAAIAVA